MSKIRLQLILNEMNISQTKLAKALGITNVSVSSICTGKTAPSLQTIEKIAKILNREVHEFIDTSARYVHVYTKDLENKTDKWQGIIKKCNENIRS